MKQFEVIYGYFNSALFSNGLPQQEFIFDVNKKFPLRWDKRNIVIGSEFVSLNAYEFFISIIHEMIHIKSYETGLDDLGINQYHKKDFLTTALDLGFFVIKHKSQGWSIISPIAPRNAIATRNAIAKRNATNCVTVKSPSITRNSSLLDVLSNVNFDFEEFRNQVKNLHDLIIKNPPSKTFFLKYQCLCPEPHNSIRSGRRPSGSGMQHPDAMCKTCGSDYHCVSELPD